MERDGIDALGEFRIIEPLGCGSFAIVYLAEDTALGRQVALKVLHPQLISDPNFVRRFGNDARAAARLDHPNVVTVFGMGDDRGRLYIPMQYCPGGTLSGPVFGKAPRLSASKFQRPPMG